MEKENKRTVEVDKEQPEKIFKAIEDLDCSIEKLTNDQTKDAIIEKLSGMLSEKRAKRQTCGNRMATCLRLRSSNNPEKVPSSARALQNIQYFQKKTLLETKTIWRCRKEPDRDRSCRGRKEVPMVRQRNGDDRRRKGEERVIIEEPEIRIRRVYTETYVCPFLQTGWRRRAFFKPEPIFPVLTHLLRARKRSLNVANGAVLSKRNLQTGRKGVEMAGSLHHRRRCPTWNYGGLRTLS